MHGFLNCEVAVNRSSISIAAPTILDESKNNESQATLRMSCRTLQARNVANQNKQYMAMIESPSQMLQQSPFCAEMVPIRVMP